MSTPHLDHPDTLAVVYVFKRQHSDPASVVNDPVMSTQEKREILADWASDRRAVVDHPALRRLDTGAVVDIDEVLDALKLLDELDSPDPFHGHAGDQSEKRGSRKAWSFWKNDDDDDPPPCPAAVTPWKPRPLPDATGSLMVA